MCPCFEGGFWPGVSVLGYQALYPSLHPHTSLPEPANPRPPPPPPHRCLGHGLSGCVLAAAVGACSAQLPVGHPKWLVEEGDRKLHMDMICWCFWRFWVGLPLEEPGSIAAPVARVFEPQVCFFLSFERLCVMCVSFTKGSNMSTGWIALVGSGVWRRGHLTALQALLPRLPFWRDWDLVV